MRIGVFGGSFDPVTTAHLQVAAAVRDRLRLDQVRFIPTAIQPFKPEGPEASAPHRLAMLRAALADHAEFAVDPREIGRGGISYTVTTLRELHREYPDDELFLMVGADAARDLPRWREADAIPALARVVAMSRGDEPGPVGPLVDITVPVPALAVSATAARAARRSGSSLDDLVPDPVAGYIRTHALYAGDE